MTSDKETYLQHVARLMRESADLIERGLIDDITIDLEFGHRTVPDPYWQTMRMVPTGERTVTITLRANDFRHVNWMDAMAQPRALTSARSAESSPADPDTPRLPSPRTPADR